MNLFFNFTKKFSTQEIKMEMKKEENKLEVTDIIPIENKENFNTANLDKVKWSQNNEIRRSSTETASSQPTKGELMNIFPTLLPMECNLKHS